MSQRSLRRVSEASGFGHDTQGPGSLANKNWQHPAFGRVMDAFGQAITPPVPRDNGPQDNYP